MKVRRLPKGAVGGRGLYPPGGKVDKATPRRGRMIDPISWSACLLNQGLETSMGASISLSLMVAPVLSLILVFSVHALAAG